VSLLWLCVFAFVAGFVDAVVGGGGLIQVPALLLFLPHGLSADVATVLGTNKFASIVGTATAAANYSRRIAIRWHSVLPAAATAFAFSLVGAHAVSSLPASRLEPIVLLLLVVVTLYTWRRPALGAVHAPAFTRRHERLAGIAMGTVLGFYDGFFGPGMGSFLIFTFIGVFGFDFLSASAAAKIVNFATNLAALLFFAFSGRVLYVYALPMAVCQMAGSAAGTRTALARGNRFVRVLFLSVASVLIARFGWRVLSPWIAP
jgi:uncharacterized membrane protein YfcA